MHDPWLRNVVARGCRPVARRADGLNARGSAFAVRLGIVMATLSAAKVKDGVLPATDLLFFGEDDRREQPLGGGAKRAADIALAAIAIIVLLPVMIIVALLVFQYDGRSPFYGHARIGWHDRNFRCWKFRSMMAESDAILAEHLARNTAAAVEWATSRKLRDDPRVTWIGRILRASSLDELPQLFNVLAGDMSLVGPRPIVTDEIALYGATYRCYRACRPGLTGLWQISGRSDCSYEKRVSLDEGYARQWSFSRDLAILLKTIPAVIGRKGSV